MSNKNLIAQQKRVEAELGEMELWYAAESGGRPSEDARVERIAKPYRGLVFYVILPLLPGRENPVLIEEQIGDSWTLRTEPMTENLRKLMGA